MSRENKKDSKRREYFEEVMVKVERGFDLEKLRKHGTIYVAMLYTEILCQMF